MATCLVVTAYMCLLLGFLSCGVSFFAPYWVLTVNENAYEGLWGRCRNIEVDINLQDLVKFKCVWFHEDDFGWEKSKPVWFLACQVLDAFGIVTLFAILFIASIHVCCACCKESISLLKAIGVVLIFGVLMLVSSLIIYGAMSYQDTKTSVNSQISRFEWGFYIGIPGVIMSMLSALLYLVESCRYDGYESGRNEVI